LWLECRAHSDVCRLRLAARRDDASDADWAVHVEAAGRWQPPGPVAVAAGHTVDSNGSPAEVVDAALQILRAQDLV
jgi:predicted kinase